jgi:hypothetical protein
MDTDLVKLIYKLCPVCCVQINNLIWALTVATTRTAVLVYIYMKAQLLDGGWLLEFGGWSCYLLYL